MKIILFLPKTKVYMYNDTSRTVSDETLFLQVQQGNEGAFEALFLGHYPALCAYARLFVEPDDGHRRSYRTSWSGFGKIKKCRHSRVP